MDVFSPEAPMVVNQGMLKVSKVVKSIGLDVQRQWVPAGHIPFGENAQIIS